MAGKVKRVEQALHKAIVEHLQTRAAANLVWFHPANGGVRSPIEAAIMKGMGVTSGVSDLILLHKSQFFALELKAPGKMPTSAQREFLFAVEKAGGRAAFCDCLDQALRLLEGWGLLRGTAQ
jgi:hypothetical protein